MKRFCPECGEPPRYHSFCTLCARLFQAPSPKWNRLITKQERKAARRKARAERDAEFRRVYAACGSIGELAAQLNKTTTWVSWRRVELGLPAYWRGPRKRHRNEWTAEQDAMLAEAIARNKNAAEAAEIIGRTENAVKNRRGNLGLPPFRHPVQERKAWPPARVERLRMLRKRGFSFSECAKRLGATRNAIAHGTRYLKEATRL